MHFDIALITANNGWAMAITGAIIVMCGLSILSFLISQLHKIIGFFEPAATTTAPAPPTGIKPTDVDLLNDMPAAAKIYKAISIDLGDRFPLTRLYEVTRAQNLPHTHITIRALREAGLLVPDGDDLFTWKI